MTMKKIYILSLVLFTFCVKVKGQQLAHSSFAEYSKHYWNPAVTGIDNTLRTSLFFRQQWIGFGANPPRTGFLSVQYPFEDLNMAAGAIVNFDQTGPVSKKGIQFLYAYTLQGILGDDSQLSLGINAGIQQFVFDPSNLVFNDLDDQLLTGNRTSSIFPAISGGFYYVSSTKDYEDNVFFAGLAFRNAFTTNVLVNDNNQARENHIHFNVGGRIYQQDTYVEPSLTLNYVTPEIVDVRLGIRYEIENAFWGGLGYSSFNEVSIQGGVVLDEFVSRYGNLRVGAIGSFSISSNVVNLGPSFEILLSYGFQL